MVLLLFSVSKSYDLSAIGKKSVAGETFTNLWPLKANGALRNEVKVFSFRNTFLRVSFTRHNTIPYNFTFGAK